IDKISIFAFAAHANLGLIYRGLGRFAESLEELRKADHQQPDTHSDEWPRASRLIPAHYLGTRKLVAIRSGTAKPKTPIEALQLATLAQKEFMKEYALAYRLFSQAFGDDPKLEASNRYNAALAAVQFAAGNDAHVNPGIEEQYRLYKKARIWLAA